MEGGSARGGGSGDCVETMKNEVVVGEVVKN